ncbi:MAG: PEGA domain-containing protein [Verrucomicrobiota bacterium]
MKIHQILSTVFAAACLSNCASITRGTTDALVVKSNPDQADVKVTRIDKPLTKKELSSNSNDGQTITGKTPVTFKLQRKGEYNVQLSKAGYKSTETRVTNHVSGMGGTAMAGNVIVGGLIGLGVDAASGATKDLTPNPIEITLQKR